MNAATVPRQQAMAAAALTLAIIGLVMLVVAGPAALLNAHYSARMETLATRLAQAQRSSAETRALQARIQPLRDTVLGTGEFLRAGPAALAAADMQRQVQQLIEDHGGNVLSMLPLDAGGEKPFRRITVKVRMQARLPALQRTLHALEQGVPRLFIDVLHVTPVFVTASNREADRLDASFDVSGYQYIESSNDEPPGI